MRHIVRVACLLLAGARCLTGEISLAPSQYQVKEWTPPEGLPEETIYRILRSSDGYLWLVTARGLLRFDGQQFVYVYPDQIQTPVPSLYSGADGELRCVVSGLGVVAVKEKQLSPVWAHEIRTQDRASLGSDFAGHSFLLDDTDIYWDQGGGKYSLWQKLPEAGIAFTEVEPGIWAVATSSKLLLVRGEHRPVETYLLPYPATTMIRGAGDDLWVGTVHGLVRFRLSGGNLREVSRLAAGIPISALALGHEGEVWVGTDRGLYRLNKNGLIPFTENIRQKAEKISAVTVDADGNVWTAYQIGGLFRLTRPLFPSWGPEEGTFGPAFTSVVDDGAEGIWTASDNGVSHIDRSGKIQRVHGPWREMARLSMTRSDANHLFVLGHSAPKMFQVDTTTLRTTPVLLPESSSNWRLLFQTRRGVIWIGNENGELYTRTLGRWTKSVVTVLASERAEMMTECRDGTLWLLRETDGIYRILGNIAIPEAVQQPERKLIRTLYCDASNRLWLGFHRLGLGRFDRGRLQTYAVSGPAVENSALVVGEDTSGYLWWGLRSGLVRVSKVDLNAYFDRARKDLPLRRFTVEGGLPGGNFGALVDSCFHVPNKILWMPHLKGAIRIDSTMLPSRSVPPKVYIQSATADGVSLDTSGELVRINPGVQRLQIAFLAPALSPSSRIWYRHHLAGFQDKPVGPHLEREATFTHVPPGDYVFHVWAETEDGAQSAQSSTLRLQLRPAWYQSLPFRILWPVAVILILVTAARIRARQITRHQRHFSQQMIVRQENERKRIAGELHDSLAQRLVIVNNFALLLLRNKNGEGNLTATQRQSIEEMSTELAGALQEVTEISYNLRPYRLDRLGLSAAIRSLLEKAAASSRISFQSEIDDVDTAFPKGHEINFYRIIQECVNNILKHSLAGSAKIFIRRSQREVHLTVQDDGAGISPASFDSGSAMRGFGLAGITERAELLGGRATIKSAPGAGTLITAEFPLRQGKQ